MVNDDSATTSNLAPNGDNSTNSNQSEEGVESEEKNLQQLMVAAEAAEAAGASSQPDKDSSTITIFNENAEVLLREVIPSSTMSSQVQGRMIAEVLKRNPSLVSAGKNTKLKIVQRSPWWAKARVSFVLLKPTSGEEEAAPSASTPGAKPSILRQHNSPMTGRKTGASGLGSSGAIAVNKRVSPFDNVTGPWICYDCIQTTEDGQNAALRLKTYYEYRTHLIQNHGFKADSQVRFLLTVFPTNSNLTLPCCRLVNFAGIGQLNATTCFITFSRFTACLRQHTPNSHSATNAITLR